MSRWAFRFLLFYIVILFTQPQNRFTILYNLQIADLCVFMCLGLHVVSSVTAGRPLLRFGPGTLLALVFALASMISLHTGVFQVDSSWNPFIELMMKNALVLVLVEAMAYSPQRAWAVLGTILFSTLWWVKAGLRLGGGGVTYVGGRIMGPAVSMVENPNGFAYLMCVTIPLYLYFFQRAENKHVRWLFLALAVAGVYIVFNTGSRTGFLALIACGLFAVPRYFAKHKNALIAATAGIAMVLTAVDPRNIERMKTVGKSVRGYFLAEEDNEDKPISMMTEDEYNSYERKMKNRHTWLLIKQHPVFGVGINPSSDFFVDELPFAHGQVHNEILMAGKQMGAVGMGIYLAFLGIIGLGGWQLQRATAKWWPDVSSLGWTLKVQAVVILVGGSFSPIPWNPYTLILVGTASAMLLNLRELTPRLQGKSPSA